MRGPLYGIRAVWSGTQIGRPSPAEIQRAFDLVSRAQLLPRIGGSQSNDWGGWYATQDNPNAPAATIEGPYANGEMAANGRWLMGDTNFARDMGLAMATKVAEQVVANLNALHRVDDWRVGTTTLLAEADPPSRYLDATNGDVLPSTDGSSGSSDTGGGTTPVPLVPTAPRSSSAVPWIIAGGAVVTIAVIALRGKRR